MQKAASHLVRMSAHADMLTCSEYKLWTDAKSREFIAEKYPWFLDTFDSYPYAIQRADVIRYFVLHYYGGIYMDLDMGCNQALDPLLRFEVILPKTIPVGVSNDLFFAAKGHPFVEQLIYSLTAFNHMFITHYATVMFSTGPMFVSALYRRYVDTHEAARPSVPDAPGIGFSGIRVLPKSLYGKNAKPGQAPDSFFIHFYGSSWHASDAGFLIFLRKYGKLLIALGIVVVVIGRLHVVRPRLIPTLLTQAAEALSWALRTVLASHRSSQLGAYANIPLQPVDGPSSPKVSSESYGEPAAGPAPRYFADGNVPEAPKPMRAFASDSARANTGATPLTYVSPDTSDSLQSVPQPMRRNASGEEHGATLGTYAKRREGEWSADTAAQLPAFYVDSGSEYALGDSAQHLSPSSSHASLPDLMAPHSRAAPAKLRAPRRSWAPSFSALVPNALRDRPFTHGRSASASRTELSDSDPAPATDDFSLRRVISTDSGQEDHQSEWANYLQKNQSDPRLASPPLLARNSPSPLPIPSANPEMAQGQIHVTARMRRHIAGLSRAMTPAILTVSENTAQEPDADRARDEPPPGLS